MGPERVETKGFYGPTSKMVVKSAMIDREAGSMVAMPDQVAASAQPRSLLVPLLGGFVMGCALQLQQAQLWHVAHYSAAMLVPALLMGLWGIGLSRSRSSRGRGPVALTAMALLTAAIGFGWTGLRAAVFQADELQDALQGRDIRVVGVISAMPQRSDAGLRFRLTLESAQLDGQARRLPPALLLSWYNGLGGAFEPGNLLPDLQLAPADLRAGERWQMSVRLKAPHGGSNPFGFDYELWLWEQGVQATGYVRAGRRDEPPVRLEQTWQHPVEWARQRVRDAILERVTDRQQAGLIAALVVGDQNAIERSDWDVFRATGVAHLMSISGLHITMFAWGAVLLVGALWRRSTRLCLACPAPSAALIAGVLLAGAYALFSGWGVPSQRTICMLATVGLLKLYGRRWPWPQVWLLAMAVIVLVDPWALLQAGFWLSFVAVGVLFATDPGSQAGASNGIRARILAMFHEQWVVTLALAPLSLLLFNQVSLVGLAANAMAIPWVTLLLTPLALSGVFWAPLWDLAAWAAAAMTVVLQGLASLPFASLSVAAAPLWAAVAGVVGGVLLVLPWPWSLRTLGLPLLVPVLLWQAPRPELGQFDLLAADIGQGNALLVRTAAHSLVYDAGPRFSSESDAGNRVLVPLLRALGEHVDTLVLSHRDTDHIGGAPAVLAAHPGAALLSSVENEHFLQALRPVRRCAAGQRWDWDAVQFEILHPQASDYETAQRSNAMSCVLRISNGVQTVLLTGDIEQPQEARLVAAGAALRADVLLAPHHGSKTSSSSAFLDAVAPRMALVQSGYRNRFGHPADIVMERYRERGIRVIDSPRCGAALWTSNKPGQVQCQREIAQRYWQHRIDGEALR